MQDDRSLVEPAEQNLTPGAAFVMFSGADEEPIVTVGIARRSPDGADLWRMLIESAELPLAAIDYPREPWVAIRPVKAGLDRVAELSHLIEIARTLAWAWILYFDDLDEKQSDKIA